MHYLKLIVLYYTWKSIFAFYNLYIRSCDFNSLVECIQRLENEIIELKEARARDQEERAKDQEARTKQDEVQKNILNFLRSKGYDDALTYGGGSTSS